jgi:hypothetical protein
VAAGKPGILGSGLKFNNSWVDRDHAICGALVPHQAAHFSSVVRVAQHGRCPGDGFANAASTGAATIVGGNGYMTGGVVSFEGGAGCTGPCVWTSTSHGRYCRPPQVTVSWRFAMKQIFALLLLITISLAPLAANEQNIRSYRHKGKLVRLDDSKVTLIIAMGEPVSKDERQEGPHDRSITVQEWYYDLGQKGTLTIEMINSRITKMVITQ